MWSDFQCETLQDYHDLYVKLDVLLLADVFENFRLLCRKFFDLDPAHYVSLPSFAWDACLKFTKCKLELFSDPDMYLFVENNIRGGISMISNRYARANNEYLEDREEFDPDKPTEFITYLDANNLYGFALCQPLPVDNFHFITSRK
jgi:hypothetical protein